MSGWGRGGRGSGRVAGGLAGGDDAASLPELEDRAKQATRRLGIPLGQDPDALAGELSPVGAIPRPSRVAVGPPSEQLRRRPDVRAAERRVEATTARIGVETADLYPRFMLAGSIGQFDVNAVANFFNGPNMYFVVGPTFRSDVFDAGRTHARIDVERAWTAVAVAEYRKTVLAALAEAQNALGAFDSEQDRRAAPAEAVAADQGALDTANQLYRQGVTGFLSVLDAERFLAAAGDALAQSDRTIGTNLVVLYKALGGDWDASEVPTAVRADVQGGAAVRSRDDDAQSVKVDGRAASDRS